MIETPNTERLTAKERDVLRALEGVAGEGAPRPPSGRRPPSRPASRAAPSTAPAPV